MRDEQLSKRIRPRPGVLRVVVSAVERAGIEERAVGAGLSVSAYLRGVGLGCTPRALTDLQAVQDLVRVNADQGRLGGLCLLYTSDAADE